MKKIIALALLAVSTMASAESIIANGTRFIYPSKDREITVQLTNTGERPALVQSWLDNGDPSVSPDDIKTPFSITPPITRVDGKSAQTLRIRALSRAGIPTDRESLWYLNILEIPPTADKSVSENKNILMMAIRSRFKFIYRPAEIGNPSSYIKQLTFTARGKTLTINNPTPFYASVSKLVKNNGKVINVGSATIAPKSTQSVSVTDNVTAGEKLTVVTLNDFGATEKTTMVVK